MSTVFKIFNLTKSVATACCSLTNKALQNMNGAKHLKRTEHALAALGNGITVRPLHTTPVRLDLMAFFDDPKNWSENEVKVGRAWKKEELRIKSNMELHQLWYILLKERNMLLTMEHECNDQIELFPSPERLDKVKISMDNLERVVRERNKAYHLLETGQTGERPARLVANSLGIRYLYRSTEHVLPPYMNTKWFRSHPIGYGGYAVRKFLLLYREKIYNEKRKAKTRSRNEVMMLLRRNPSLDLEMLRKKYPGVDIDKLRRSDKIRGHYVPNVGV